MIEQIEVLLLTNPMLIAAHLVVFVTALFAACGASYWLVKNWRNPMLRLMFIYAVAMALACLIGWCISMVVMYWTATPPTPIELTITR